MRQPKEIKVRYFRGVPQHQCKIWRTCFSVSYNTSSNKTVVIDLGDGHNMRPCAPRFLFRTYVLKFRLKRIYTAEVLQQLECFPATSEFLDVNASLNG